MDFVAMLQSAGSVLRPGVRDQMPSAALVALMTGLLAAGAPGRSPSLETVIDRAEDASIFWLGVLVIAIAMVTIFIQPLLSSIVAIYEGLSYRRLARRLLDFFARRQRYRRRLLIEKFHVAAEASYFDDLGVTASKLARYPDHEEAVVATRLGNVLRRAEIRAGGRYGLDTGVTLPRLEPLLPQSSAALLSSRRDDLYFATRFSAALLIGAVASAALLIAHGWWLLLPVGLLALAWLAYQNSVSAAALFGETLEVVFDLHRFELYSALRLLNPRTLAEERVMGRSITMMLLDQLSSDELDHFRAGDEPILPLQEEKGT